MKIFWLNSNLCIRPESTEELRALTCVYESVKQGPRNTEFSLRSGNMQPSVQAGDLDLVDVRHQVSTSPVGNLANQEPIVGINEPREMVP
jgi:hypothetical protein